MIDVTKSECGMIGTVTLQRPEKLNALTGQMWDDLARVMTDLSTDGSLRVVVITGAGRAFCVGADIGEFEETRAGKTQAIAYGKRINGAVSAIEDCVHPVVAAIRGHCVGGGLELAAACDIRLSTPDGIFGVPVKRLGLPVDYPELQALLRLLGPSNTLELLFEGRLIDAAEALQKGLVNRIVDTGSLEDEVAATCGRIIEGAPLVARWHKRMVRTLGDSPPLSEEVRTAPFVLFESEDYRIGTRAFLAKEDPVFGGS